MTVPQVPVGYRPVAMRRAPKVPSALTECGFHFFVVFSTLGDLFAIPIPLMGVGLLLLLAGACVVRLQSRALAFYSPLIFPVACAMSYVAIQLIVHNESLRGDYVRPFVILSLLAVVIRSLYLRPGFLHRFAFMTLAVGLMTIPYLDLGSGADRARLDSAVSIANPNDLAAWFGFCCVYFLILGIETERTLVRVTAWLLVVACLAVVGLTVSRGALLAIGVAALVGLRRFVRVGLVPLLVFVVLMVVVYQSGLFERAAALYAARALEETGRFIVWPLALERFLGSPLLGVGASDIGIYIAELRRDVTPHNPFLLIALASGIFPLLCFAAFWGRAFHGVLHPTADTKVDARYCLPLLIYTLLSVQSGNFAFAAPWAIGTLTIAISINVTSRVPQRFTLASVHAPRRMQTATQ